MSWFGETFGDSLNSLKGQITKITKEVLSENDDSNDKNEETITDASLIKELEALCESKDLEIFALKEELEKLQKQFKSEIEYTKNQNPKTSFDNVHNNDSRFGQLEKDLLSIKQERDHLNSCLDVLQSEHQHNLDQVISMRDKYKLELEELKKENASLKVENDKLNLSNNGNSELLSNKDKEVYLLKEEIQRLQSKIEDDTKSNKEIVNSLKKEVESQENLKEQLQKLLNEINVINENKHKSEEDNKKILFENNQLKEALDLMEKDIKEVEIKLKLLQNEKQELLIKFHDQENFESKISGLINTQVKIQNKIKELMQDNGAKVKENLNDENVLELLARFENELKLKENSKVQANDKSKEDIQNLQSDLKKLREENENLIIESKKNSEKWSVMEKTYQEEISELKKTASELKLQRQTSINQSQTDDVKKLEQEVTQYMNLLMAKNNELKDCTKSLTTLEQELKTVNTFSINLQQELSSVVSLNKKLEEEIELLRNKNNELLKSNNNLEKKIETTESKNLELLKLNDELKTNLQKLDKGLQNFRDNSDKIKKLEDEIKNIENLKNEKEYLCSQLQKENLTLKNDFEALKAQLIIKESNTVELMKSNSFLQGELNKLQFQNNELQKAEKEIQKWKDASVDLEIQRQDFTAKIMELENECLRLKNELDLMAVKEAEISQLKETNFNLMQSCQQLHYDIESKRTSDHFQATENSELIKKFEKQQEMILELQEENNELKTRIQKFQMQIKEQMMNSEDHDASKEGVQHHRRSRSAAEVESPTVVDYQKGLPSSENIAMLKQALEQEQSKVKSLQLQLQETLDKEGSARKELERLKVHLIEVQDHYTEEAVEDKKLIDELKSKLIAAEEQLQNSSTLYTSMKVRDNQHLESLQSQIRMITSQRDDFQAKLSAAEDEVQKHKASLMSLQIVLEQFQQDKEREMEEVALKHEKQMQLSQGSFITYEKEIENLRKQLSEAKNGLKAASRLGEQLEKKTQHAVELEESLSQMKNNMLELENKLAAFNQSSSEKIDKSLIKNLVIGYILSSNSERKAQVLRIMDSVLEFDETERKKMAIDSSHSGWLSNILHPKASGSTSNQSLSEAFIKFLENESRPQPQLKFHPEQFEAQPGSSTPKSTSTSPKPTGRFSELVLPTFSSTLGNESSVILKSVLKDS